MFREELVMVECLGTIKALMGVFASNLDISSFVDVEIMAVIQAIELAWIKEWKHVHASGLKLIQPGLVLNFLHAPHLVLWRLRVAWDNCLYCIVQMHFKSSHNFKEGNQVANAFANIGLSSSGLVWWNEAPPILFF